MSEVDLHTRGRRVVVAIIVSTLTLSASIIIAFLVIRGFERIVQQSVRFGLAVLLSVYLYRGAPAARWIAAVLFLIGGVMALNSLHGLERLNLAALIQIVFAVIYLASCITLLALPSVRAHFDPVSRS